MERKVVGLIAVSTLVIGILLWSKQEAEKPPPRYMPTVSVAAACSIQGTLSCELALPGATREQARECTKEYDARCVSCLRGVQLDRRFSRLEPPDECQALKQWMKKHR